MKIEIFEDLQRVRMSPRSESCFSPETCNPLQNRKQILASLKTPRCRKLTVGVAQTQRKKGRKNHKKVSDRKTLWFWLLNSLYLVFRQPTSSQNYLFDRHPLLRNQPTQHELLLTADSIVLLRSAFSHLILCSTLIIYYVSSNLNHIYINVLSSQKQKKM